MRLSLGSILRAGVFVSAILVADAPDASAACTHYASPTGTGNGSSSSQPFKIASFWPVAKAGTTLCLLDGQYTGSTSMINPPQNLAGTASAPITIKALNDGKVTIDGTGATIPVRLYYNNYFVIEGINARNSSASVVDLSRSSNNIIRRVAAWDAADNNTNIFGIHNGTNNLLEDVAGWGVARKIISTSQGGNATTIRRAWARWEGSHVIGPKMTYALAYNNYSVVCENCIGTWSGGRMKQSYTLLDYYGQPWTGNGAGTYSNYGVNQPYGIFAVDRLDGDKNANTKLLGSIAYVQSSDRFAPSQAVFITKMDSMEVSNTAVYYQPDYHLNKTRFALYNLASAVGTNLYAKNLTGIGGAASTYGSDWKKSNLSEGASLSSVGNIFSSTSGANLCRRYQNRALTDVPLWPWPMNQRIIDGLIQSGRTAVDVTLTVEKMFGSIPASCKTSGGTVAPGVPSAPLHLVVGP